MRGVTELRAENFRVGGVARAIFDVVPPPGFDRAVVPPRYHDVAVPPAGKRDVRRRGRVRAAARAAPEKTAREAAEPSPRAPPSSSDVVSEEDVFFSFLFLPLASLLARSRSTSATVPSPHAAAASRRVCACVGARAHARIRDAVHERRVHHSRRVRTSRRLVTRASFLAVFSLRKLGRPASAAEAAEASSFTLSA